MGSAVEERLVELVRENRFTIAVVFPLIGAITLVASAESLLPSVLAYNAALILFGTAVMRLPLIVGILPSLTKRAGLILLALVGYTYAIEIVGVRTGLPYGAFEYGVTLGPMLFDVPLALPLFFIPLTVNAYLLVIAVLPLARSSQLVRLPVAIALVLVIDLILDPAAVAVGFWSYDAGGAYYDVPWTNYAGWVVSGTVAILAIEAAFDLDSLETRLTDREFILDDLVSFTLLWGAINALYGHWIPVALTLGLIGLLVRDGRIELRPGSVRLIGTRLQRSSFTER